MLRKKRPWFRPLKNSYVDEVARRMTRGTWIPCDPYASPLAIDSRGRLVDGQHRLEAVIKSNKTIRFRIHKAQFPEL
jgi:hypothetical protein